MHLFSVIALCSLATIAACGKGNGSKSKPALSSAPEEVDKPAVTPSANPDAGIDNSVSETMEFTAAIDGKKLVAVGGSGLTASISGSSHKASAPVAGVRVLITNANGEKVELSWTIESQKFDGEWRELAGRRYNSEINEYVDEALPGWQARLLSVDDYNSGGSPVAVTIALRKGAQKIEK